MAQQQDLLTQHIDGAAVVRPQGATNYTTSEADKQKFAAGAPLRMTVGTHKDDNGVLLGDVVALKFPLSTKLRWAVKYREDRRCDFEVTADDIMFRREGCVAYNIYTEISCTAAGGTDKRWFCGKDADEFERLVLRQMSMGLGQHANTLSTLAGEMAAKREILAEMR